MLRFLTQKLRTQSLGADAQPVQTKVASPEVSKESAKSTPRPGGQHILHSRRSPNISTDCLRVYQEMDREDENEDKDKTGKHSQDMQTNIAQPLKELQDNSEHFASQKHHLDWENHSSEEELSTYLRELKGCEKRKWSQVHSVVGWYYDSSSSSDDEVKELCLKSRRNRPIEYQSPVKVKKVTHDSRVVMAAVRTSESSSRKRSRHAKADENDRPFLDFEKMQQRMFTSSLRRISNTVSAAQSVTVIKVKDTISDKPPPTWLCDPSIYDFQSISTSHSTLNPVEDPLLSACS